MIKQLAFILPKQPFCLNTKNADILIRTEEQLFPNFLLLLDLQYACILDVYTSL